MFKIQWQRGNMYHLMLFSFVIGFQVILGANIRWNNDEIALPEPFNFTSVQDILSYLDDNNYWKNQRNTNNNFTLRTMQKANSPNQRNLGRFNSPKIGEDFSKSISLIFFL